MNSKIIFEGTLQDETVTYTYQEFCEVCVIESPLINEMIEFGIIEVQGNELQSLIFTSKSMTRAKKALRLYHDLNINWAGISLALDLLDEINELRQLVALHGESQKMER